MQVQIKKENEARRGSALVAAIIFIAVIASLGSSMLQVDLRIGKSRQSMAAQQQAFFAAEAGMSEAYVHLMTGLADPAIGTTVDVGTEGTPKMFAGARYWASVTRLDFRRFSIVATGQEDASVRRQETILSYAPNGLFQYGAFGGAGVNVAANSMFDSYDSILGDHTSQIQAGMDYARENVTVGSNGDIRLFSNTRVYGDAHPGPGGTLTESGSGHVVTGSRDAAAELVTLPPIAPPVVASSGPLTTLANATIGPGTIGYDQVTVDGGATLTIEGPADIVMEDFFLGGGGSTIAFDTTNGPVRVFSAGDWEMLSNSNFTSTSDSAVDVQIFIAGDTTPGPDRATVSLASNGAIVGAIYAPNASLSLPSNFEIYGSVMAGELALASNSIIHFDEALLYDGDNGEREFVTLLWHPLGLED